MVNPLITTGVLLGLSISVLALYRSGHVPGTLPYWLKQLQHANRHTRLKTVHLLGQMATPQAAYCLSLVVQSEDQDIKQLAIKGLLQAKQPATLGALAVASMDREPKIRRMIAEGLALFLDPGVPKLLIEMLRDPDESVAAAAIRSLGELRDISAVAPLAHALESGEDIARLAAQALLEIGRPCLDELCRLLPVLSPIGCERLIPLLVALDAHVALEPLIALMNTTDNLYLLKSAIAAVAEVPTQEATQALLAFVSDERHACRPYALGKLQTTDHAGVTELLIRLLGDRDVQIRRAAAEALGKGYHPAWIDPLLAALDDEDDEVFKLASEALGQYEDPRVLQRLLERLWPEEYEAICEKIEGACHKPLAEIRSVDELVPILRRISSKEARGNEEQRIRHHLQSALILTRPRTVAGFQDLTNTVLVFKMHDFNSEYQVERLHPKARKALRMQPSLQALHLWKTSLR